MHRIKVRVSEVFGNSHSIWALPCIPIIDEVVKKFSVPPIDSMVWIQFESGNPQFPVCIGYGEMPKGN